MSNTDDAEAVMRITIPDGSSMRLNQKQAAICALGFFLWFPAGRIAVVLAIGLPMLLGYCIGIGS